MESAGWNGFFIAMAICGGISALILIPLWSIKVHPRFAVEEKTEEAPAANA
jgi:sugar phosphate permease